MKKLVIAASLLLGQITFAQDRVELERQAQESVRQAEISLWRNLPLVSNESLVRITQMANEMNKLASGFPPPTPSLVVFVNIESDQFMLEGNSISQLRDRCIARTSTISTENADDISVTLNGASLSARKDTGYWKTPAAKCAAVTSLIAQVAGKLSIRITNSAYLVAGNAEGQGIVAEGNSIAELEASCVANFELQESSDDLSVNVNGGPTKSAHKDIGFWRTKQEICATAIATALK